MSEPPSKEKPVEAKMWLEEARRQFDLANKIDQQLTGKIQWLLGFFLLVIGAITTTWDLIGFSSNNLLKAILVILSVIGLFFFWNISRSSPAKALNIYKEIKRYNETENSNSDYQFWRVIQGLDQSLRIIEKSNKTRSEWYERTLILIVVIFIFLLATLFLS